VFCLWCCWLRHGLVIWAVFWEISWSWRCDADKEIRLQGSYVRSRASLLKEADKSETLELRSKVERDSRKYYNTAYWFLGETLQSSRDLMFISSSKLFEKWEGIQPRLGLNTSFVPRVPGKSVSLVVGDQIRSQPNLLLHMSVADFVKTLPSFCKCLYLGIACYNNSFYCA
jgi:hypothetical protein